MHSPAPLVKAAVADRHKPPCASLRRPPSLSFRHLGETPSQLPGYNGLNREGKAGGWGRLSAPKTVLHLWPRRQTVAKRCDLEASGATYLRSLHGRGCTVSTTGSVYRLSTAAAKVPSHGGCGPRPHRTSMASQHPPMRARTGLSVACLKPCPPPPRRPQVPAGPTQQCPFPPPPSPLPPHHHLMVRPLHPRGSRQYVPRCLQSICIPRDTLRGRTEDASLGTIFPETFSPDHFSGGPHTPHARGGGGSPNAWFAPEDVPPLPPARSVPVLRRADSGSRRCSDRARTAGHSHRTTGPAGTGNHRHGTGGVRRVATTGSYHVAHITAGAPAPAHSRSTSAGAAARPPPHHRRWSTAFGSGPPPPRGRPAAPPPAPRPSRR